MSENSSPFNKAQLKQLAQPILQRLGSQSYLIMQNALTYFLHCRARYRAEILLKKSEVVMLAALDVGDIY